jgi:hypothetical protein
MSVVEIKRYRAKCHGCGGLGDLRDEEKSALAYVLEKSGWRFILHEDGGEKLLCDICQKEREGLDAATKAQLAATAARALAAQAAAFNRVREEMRRSPPGASMPGTHWHRRAVELHAEERARRGLP